MADDCGYIDINTTQTCEITDSETFAPLVNNERKDEPEMKSNKTTTIQNLKDLLTRSRTRAISLNDTIAELGDFFDIPDTFSTCTVDENYIQVIENNLQQLITHLEKDELSPIQIIEQSSALNGIFLNQNVNDWTRKRGRMVTAHKDINFKETGMNKHLVEEEFYDHEEECNFNKAINAAGERLARGVKLSYQDQRHKQSQHTINVADPSLQHYINTVSQDCEESHVNVNQIYRKDGLHNPSNEAEEAPEGTDREAWTQPWHKHAAKSKYTPHLLKDKKPELQIDLRERQLEQFTEQRLDVFYQATNIQMQPIYYSKETCFIFPVAIWSPCIQDITINDEALLDLLKIEEMLLNNALDLAKQTSIEFFNKYGSHFYFGDIYFGGIFKVKSCYHGDTESDIAYVKQLVNSVHSKTLEAYRYEFGEEIVSEALGSIEDSKVGKVTDIEKDQVEDRTFKVGGPQDVEIMQLWEFGLIESKSSWVVVNSGNPYIQNGTLCSVDYVGVWSLIQNDTSFKNRNTLGQFLLVTWQMLTGFVASKDWSQITHRLEERDNFRQFLDRLTDSLKLNYTVEKLLSVYEDLRTYIEDMNTNLGDSVVWNGELQDNPVVYRLFENIPFFTLSYVERVEIRRSIKYLMELACVEHFPYDAGIMQRLNDERSPAEWIYDGDHSKGIDEWISMIRYKYTPQCPNDIPHTTGSDSQSDTGSDSLTRMMSEMKSNISDILDAFLRTNDTFAFVFFFSLLIRLDYDAIEHSFRSQLTKEKLKLFLNDFETDVKIYKANQAKNNLIQQASAFIFLVHVLQKKDLASLAANSPAARFSEIALYLKNIDIQIESRIAPYIFKKNVDLKSLLQLLNDTVEGKSNLMNYCLSWNYFENLPEELYGKLSGNFSPTSESEFPDIGEIGTTVDILNVLGIANFFPGKLSLRDALSIRDDQFSKPTKLSNVPWVILRKIISMNFEFREKVLDDFFKSVSPDVSDDTGDLLSGLLSSDDIEDKELMLPGKQLHPLDVFLAIFQCCDPFLKRTIVHKMAVCQLAVPFIYQKLGTSDHVLSIWPLRDVRINEDPESVLIQQIKTISFIRIGRGPLRSKSKLINEVLRDLNDEHSTFFHKDCPLGMYNRTESNGMVEVSWFVPTKCTSTAEQRESYQGKYIQDQEYIEQLKYPMTVFNLRGDAFNYQTQTEALLEISNLLIVLITFDDLQDKRYSEILQKVHHSRGSVVLMTNITDFKRARSFIAVYSKEMQLEQSKTNILSLYDKTKDRQLNVSEVKHKLTQCIANLLDQKNPGIILERILDNLPHSITSDEGDMCNNGRRCADRLSEEIDKYEEVSTRKNVILPLQGESLWHRWSKQQKEIKRTGKKATYDTEEKLHQSMTTIRMKQVETLNEAPTVVAYFIETLLQISSSDKKIQFFLFWVQYALDCKSRKIIPGLLNRFSLAFEKYETSRTKDNLATVDLAELELARASLGLEHLFREMGQIYEAFIYCRDDVKCDIAHKTMQIVLSLPALVAKLLVLGQPFELMDGDTSNVPLKWTKAVFSEIENLIGKKKFLRVSVLGVQSSGKSTLLNSMFGLRFAVSAGRCTRGIYAQIVPVDHSRSSLKFDYAMIIDTEGLRAPELAGDKIHHDNELATLVIGLADIVIINIKGETIADMENVLQIVIHGLLRLKQANKQLDLRQYGVFVHQNVSARDAKAQMLQGNKKIIQNLDAMTKEAATQEHIRDITSFTEVIKFNPTQDVKYIPDLWRGSPPLAPVSPKYSESVTEVANWILGHLGERAQALSLHDFYLHFDGIWKGILADDFVFSFRNCLEVKAYGILESEYQRLVWKMEERKLEWMSENIKLRLNNSETVEDLERCILQLEEDFIIEINKTLSEVREQLIVFLDSSELSDHMIHWKENKVINLELKTYSLQEDVKQKIQHERDKCKAIFTNKDILLSKEKIINQKAKELADSFKGEKPTRHEMEQRFETLWTQLLDELAPAISKKKNLQIVEQLRKEISNALYNKFPKYAHLVNSGLTLCGIGRDPGIKQLKGSITIKDITNDHIGVTGLRRLTRYVGLSDFRQPTLNIINEIFQKIDSNLESLFNENVEYDKAQFSILLEIIRDRFSQHNDKSSNNDFSLKPNLEIFVALHVSRYSLGMFERIINANERGHGLRSRLQNHKPIALQLFLSTCEAKTQQLIATNLFCTELKSLIEEKLERGIPLQMQREIRQKFNFQKHHLIKAVMTDLATDENFNQFMEYITCADTFVEAWITRLTKRVIFTKHGSGESLYMKWINDSLDIGMSEIISVVKNVTEECYSNSIHEWIDNFRKQAEVKHLNVTKNSFQHVTDYCVNDFNEFTKNIVDHLNNEVTREIIVEFNSHNPDLIKWSGKTPYHEIFESLWGCREKCPWCAEPCQKADEGHGSKADPHMCIQHRPDGVTGTAYTNNNKLTVESCNFNVQSTLSLECGKNWCKCQTKNCKIQHPYRQYKSYLKDWDIAPTADMSNSTFWNWFIAKYSRQLALYFGQNQPDIPKSWSEISKENAIDSLSEVYG